MKRSADSPSRGESHASRDLRGQGPRLTWYPYLTVPKQGELTTICLSDSLVLLEVHYDANVKGIVYCPGNKDCPFCRLCWEPTLYGYAAGQECTEGKEGVRPGRYGIIVMTQESLNYCPQNIYSARDLRGKMFRQFRFQGHGYTGAVRTEVIGSYDKIKALRPTWNMVEDMARRFGYAPEKLKPFLPVETNYRRRG